MHTTGNTAAGPVDGWLRSGQVVRLCGFGLVPVPHPLLPDTAQCVVKGQAAVYFLQQRPHGCGWLLKKFAPSRRPSDNYLTGAYQCLPGGIEFFTCTQRRLVQPDHIDHRFSTYRSPELWTWLEGTVLLPKVPGMPWSSMADALRDDEAQWTSAQRLVAAANLAECVNRLEAGGCAHRDLSCSNVFVADEGRVYLIDWDSLYHAQLPYQPNTTIGTLGYVAPFTRSATGEWDPGRSWCPGADRYALAILVAEILLTASGCADVQEDGTMFAQSQLDRPDEGYVQAQGQTLGTFGTPVQRLFDEALHAGSFDACPTPAHWCAVLRSRLRLERNASGAPDHCFTMQPCSTCGVTTRVTDEALAKLQQRGAGLLCRPCREARRRQRDSTHPLVACEHCQRPTRIAREKLTALRAKGSPVLCSTCLSTQISTWRQEQSAWDGDHPQVVCAQCRKTFRLGRAKRDLLVAQGKAPLCRACLQAVLNDSVRRSSRPPFHSLFH